MKEAFFGYYPPTPEEYRRLLVEGLIVTDANVLLDLYRLPASAREELLTVLELLKERLWIPYQVALEFQRRRVTVMSHGRKSTETAIKSINDLIELSNKSLEQIQIEKHGLGLDPKPLLEELRRAQSNLLGAINKVHDAQLEIASSDPIRERLDRVFSGRVGLGPNTQEELDSLIEGGETRYSERIPPGFMDAEKEKNPNEATFIHDHVKYPRKYGDLILWKQILSHVKETDSKTVLFVTSDSKDDWWWREQGKTIGPHPELIREIRRKGGAELFWIYTSAQFSEQARQYAEVNVSEETVAELKEVAEGTPKKLQSRAAGVNALIRRLLDGNESTDDIPRSAHQTLEEAVYRWLSWTEENVSRNPNGFPDFIVDQGYGETHGYEVRYVKELQNLFSSQSSVINGILKGYLEVKEGRLSTFVLIAVVSRQVFRETEDSELIRPLRDRLVSLLEQYPISGIVIGAVFGTEFRPLIRQNSDRHSSNERV